MKIKESVVNTFNRVGIDYKTLLEQSYEANATNWITGVTVNTTPLIAECVKWVYKTQLDYERGLSKINLSDFDRVRYFILEADKDVYYTCID